MELSLKLLVLYKKNKKHRGRGAVLGFCILIVGWNWHFLLSLIRFLGISLTYS